MRLVELQEYEPSDQVLREYQEYLDNPDQYEARPGQEMLDELDLIIEQMEAEQNVKPTESSSV